MDIKALYRGSTMKRLDFGDVLKLGKCRAFSLVQIPA
jgi:hypothetical protein